MATINKTHIEEALQRGELGEVIKMALALLKANDGSDKDNVVIQSARYHSLMRDVRSNLISPANANMTRAQLTATMQHYIGNFKSSWEVEYDLPNSATPITPPVQPVNPVGPAQDAAKNDVKVILCLSSNPTNTDRLATEVEYKKIDKAIKLSPLDNKYKVIYVPAVTVGEFRSAILVHKPAIVHFSGHGSKAGKLILHDERERGKEVEPVALGNFFSIIKQAKISIECVVLNACYSKIQATEIHKSVDTVIGMSDKVGDDSAIAFAGAFYSVLGTDQPYNIAFLLGCNDIDLNGLSGEDTPQIFQRN